jgi:hypothetical protein
MARKTRYNSIAICRDEKFLSTFEWNYLITNIKHTYKSVFSFNKMLINRYLIQKGENKMKKIIVILCLVAATAMAKPLGEIPEVKNIYNEFLAADEKLEADIRAERLNPYNIKKAYDDVANYFMYKGFEIKKDASPEIKDGVSDLTSGIRGYLVFRQIYHSVVMEHGKYDIANSVDQDVKNTKTKLQSILQRDVK